MRITLISLDRPGAQISWIALEIDHHEADPDKVRAEVGCLWVKMTKVALAKKDGDEAAFHQAKLATARFYVARMLPRHGTHFANVMAGSAPVMELAEAAF